MGGGRLSVVFAEPSGSVLCKGANSRGVWLSASGRTRLQYKQGQIISNQAYPNPLQDDTINFNALIMASQVPMLTYIPAYISYTSYQVGLPL